MKKQTTSIGAQQSFNLQKFLNGPSINSAGLHNSSTSNLMSNGSILSPFSLKTHHTSKH